MRIGLSFPASPATTKGETKKILDFALFVARECDASTAAKEQSQVSKIIGDDKFCIGSEIVREKKVCFVASFRFEAQAG